MPADHVITGAAAFRRVLSAGAALATQGAVVTFGIAPDAPETGYGYIEAGAPYPGANGAAREIARFVEKPDLATAQAYLDAGTYLWNSGLFMLRASVWLSAIGRCRADILSACQAAWDQGQTDGEFVRVNPQAFAQCPTDSIDYAVMERIAAEAATEPPKRANCPRGWCWHWMPVGRTLGPGTRCGTCCPKTPRAMWPRGMCCCTIARTR